MSMGEQPLPELSVEELLRRARAGEDAALEELFRRYQPRLDAWASQRASRGLPGGTRPSDVVQESALRAFQKFSTFNGNSEGEWLAWLKQVVLSQSVRLVREAKSQKRDDSDAVPLDAVEAQGAPARQRSPSQVTAHHEEWRQLLSRFHQLPDDQREALSLFHLKELPVAEVARCMGRTKTSVESLMQRGLRTLRHQMAGGTGEEPEGSPAQAAARNAADAALLVYLRRCEAGEVVDADAFVSEYPACAEELRGMLHWIARLRALRPASPS
jgi:RNA polymerase sigma-70 factor (ECF subfamily)